MPSLDYVDLCDTKNLNKGCKSGYILNSLEFLKSGYVYEKCWKSQEDTEECPADIKCEK